VLFGGRAKSVDSSAAEAAAGDRSAEVRRFRDWMAWMTSVESGPRLSRGPQVMVPGLQLGRGLGVARGTKRRDAMGGGVEASEGGRRTGCSGPLLGGSF
jgi:hypothetical protein